MDAPLAERAACTRPYDARPCAAHADDLPLTAIVPRGGQELPDPDWQPL
jgi:hypothetical protein